MADQELFFFFFFFSFYFIIVFPFLVYTICDVITDYGLDTKSVESCCMHPISSGRYSHGGRSGSSMG